MAQNPLGINQGTNAFLNFDLQGTVNTQVINVGTISGNLPGGSIVMTNGTLAALPNLPQGSIQVTAGTIGTVIGMGVVSNLTNGSIAVTAGTIATLGTMGTLGTALGMGVVTTVTNLSNGTIQNSGTVTGVGSVSSLGSLGVLNAGTISMLNAGTISVLPNLPQGSINVTAGTIGTVTGVGVVTSVGSIPGIGILTALSAGTLSPLPTIANVTYGTHGTTGASVFGTLAGGTGSGAGTEIFLTSVSLTIPSTSASQDVSIGWGTNGGTFHAGTGLIVRGNFPPGGGIQKTFWPSINSGTQAQLCLFQAGAGTVDVSVTYFITPSTL